MSLAADSDDAFRDYETDGVPASGAHKPVKSAIRSWARSLPGDVSLFKYVTSKALRDAITAQSVDHTDAGMLTELTGNVQTAFDEGPLGGRLLLPAGDLPLNGKVTMNRQMDLISPSGTRLVGWLGSADNLLEVRFQEAASGNGDARRTVFEGFTAYFATGGLSVIDVMNDVALASNLHMTFRNLGIGGLDTGAGAAIRLRGVVTQVHTIEHCGIDNQVWLDGCADSCVLRDNLMGGTKVANRVELAEGAFKTLFDHNTIVTRDGAFLITDGAEIDIVHNQMEQSGTNAGVHQATITVLASAYGNRQTQILRNNFGGGGNVQYSIYADGAGSYFVDDLYVDGNAFNTTGSGVDVLLNSSKVRWARVPVTQRLRGNRNGVVLTGSVASANTADAEVAVTDTGLGTMGVWQPASTLSLGNSWTASADFGYMKDEAGIVWFRGHLIAGTVTASTLVGVMPAGFRPPSPIYNVCASSGTTTAGLYFNSNGNINALGSGVATNEFYPSPFKVARHTKYDPGS